MNLVKRRQRTFLPWEELFDLVPFLETGNVETAKKVFTPIEIESDEKNVYLKTELPGVDKKDIEIEYKDGVLAISGEKKIERKGKEDGYKYSELSQGKFKRFINLETEVDFNKGKADYENGILSITLPKAKEQKTQKLLVG